MRVTSKQQASERECKDFSKNMNGFYMFTHLVAPKRCHASFDPRQRGMCAPTYPCTVVDSAFQRHVLVVQA